MYQLVNWLYIQITIVFKYFVLTKHFIYLIKGIGIWREWDTIIDVFTGFSRNNAIAVGGLNEEIFETLQREREAEKQTSEE